MGLAADRGVTICFADLDGADGLWVPEERTILVSRGLSESRTNEVIEHELGHVAIDDQHAELDAGVFRPPPGPLHTLLAKRWATPALSAAAFVALVGGVTAGLAAALPDGPSTPDTNTTPEVTEGPIFGRPTTMVVPRIDAQGRTTYVTITYTPTRPGTPVPSATATISPKAPPRSKPGVPGSSAPSLGPSTTTSPAPAVTTTTPAPEVTTPSDTPTTDPTTPVAELPPDGDSSTVAGPADDLPVVSGPTT